MTDSGPDTDFWTALASLSADRWERVKANMLKHGYDVEQGACLYIPTSYVVTDPPDWVIMTAAPEIDVPSMCKTRPVVDAPKGRLLFWMCPDRCGRCITWDKEDQPPSAHCGCGATSQPCNLKGIAKHFPQISPPEYREALIQITLLLADSSATWVRVAEVMASQKCYVNAHGRAQGRLFLPLVSKDGVQIANPPDWVLFSDLAIVPLLITPPIDSDGIPSGR